MTDQNIYCPICQNKMYINLDEWGHTPFHLHCAKGDINISMRHLSDTDKWIKYPLKKHMYIEDFPGELIINSFETRDLCVPTNVGLIFDCPLDQLRDEIDQIIQEKERKDGSV